MEKPKPSVLTLKSTNEFEKDGKKERVIGAYISEYKVLEKYKATEEVTDDKLPFQ